MTIKDQILSFVNSKLYILTLGISIGILITAISTSYRIKNKSLYETPTYDKYSVLIDTNKNISKPYYTKKVLFITDKEHELAYEPIGKTMWWNAQLSYEIGKYDEGLDSINVKIYIRKK
jgi:hypothetical protein